MLTLPRSAALVARLTAVERTGSTNTDLLRAAAEDPEGWPAPAVLVTDDQTAGRGRLDRSWVAAPGEGLAISVLLRPAVPAGVFGWLSLAAGAAMTTSLRDHGIAAATKWPNDVLIGDRKVCGVLAEGLPDGSGVVVGAGLNTSASAEALPVDTATSLVLEGGPTDPDLLVAGYLERLLDLVRGFEDAAGDPGASLRAVVLAASGTLGRRVRVTLPGGGAVTGTAVDIDPDGRIVVDEGPILGTSAIAAGDVEHLRYE